MPLFLDYDRIAARCEGYTGSNILELCKKAAYFPIRELLDQEKSGSSQLEPRALSQSDLERVLASTTKTKVAANEYSRLNVLSPTWNQTDPDFVQAAIGELSKLVTSHMLNLPPEDVQEDA